MTSFFSIAFWVFTFVGGVSFVWPPILWLLVLIVPLFLLGVYDLCQKRHNVWRVFPVVGHIRNLFETFRPEIQQYFIEPDWGGRPLNRDQRKVVYARAKGEIDTVAFGTQLDVNRAGHEWLKHSVWAIENEELPDRIKIGEGERAYYASHFNISAMSFGALSKNAVLALNRGAKEGQFYHNTGEGGISPYHLEYGGDLVWQIGTGYFGCRTEEGKFCEDQFCEKANDERVKMIEIKLSQGAKPGGGGILPGAKVSEEIALARGVPMGVDVISPPSHSAFSTPIELMEFVAKCREMTGGKPIGIKICIGEFSEFFAILKAMIDTGITVDFITVDGAEGGTGASPLCFANHIGTPLVDALVFVQDALVGTHLREKIRVITSGKITSEFEMIAKMALGADIVNSARGMMLALGCIQSLRCNTNMCPTGITTNDANRMYGLVVEQKYQRVARYHQCTVKALMKALGAAGLRDPSELTRHHIVRRVDGHTVMSFADIYPVIEPGALLERRVPQKYEKHWLASDPYAS